jgi:hypothetical protein
MMLEIKAAVVQGAIFLVGLVISLAVGMFLAKHLEGAAGLLFATILAGAGLLGGAVLSQVVHDHLVTAEADPPATPPKN